MLTYFGSGLRDYSSQPVTAGQRRPGWEFQAVTAGQIARVNMRESEAVVLQSQTLWLSRPGSAHGWTGRPDAEVVVFHFRHVPRVLEQRLGDQRFHQVGLGKSGAARVRELARGVARYWRKPSPGMLLAAEAALSELSLLVYEDLAGDPAGDRATGAREVDRALQLYSERMAAKPSLAEVASEVGVSIAHLRRLFHAHMGHGPKEAFAQLREQRIMELLTDTDCGLGTITELTGFSEPGALSRAFRARFGCPPSRVRLPARHSTPGLKNLSKP